MQFYFALEYFIEITQKILFQTERFKGPFKSTSFLSVFTFLIFRKINKLTTLKNLLSKCDLNGPFCYTGT